MTVIRFLEMAVIRLVKLKHYGPVLHHLQIFWDQVFVHSIVFPVGMFISLQLLIHGTATKTAMMETLWKMTVAQRYVM